MLSSIGKKILYKLTRRLCLYFYFNYQGTSTNTEESMNGAPKIAVIIPAYNEENSIAKVIADIPAGLVQEVIVVNNNSNDNTEINARNAGATVLREKRAGYGYACLKGIESIKQLQTAHPTLLFLLTPIIPTILKKCRYWCSQ